MAVERNLGPRIGVNGKQMLIGWYDSIEEAEIAYWQAKSVLHVGFFKVMECIITTSYLPHSRNGCFAQAELRLPMGIFN